MSALAGIFGSAVIASQRITHHFNGAVTAARAEMGPDVHAAPSPAQNTPQAPGSTIPSLG